MVKFEISNKRRKRIKSCAKMLKILNHVVGARYSEETEYILLSGGKVNKFFKIIGEIPDFVEKEKIESIVKEYKMLKKYNIVTSMEIFNKVMKIEYPSVTRCAGDLFEKGEKLGSGSYGRIFAGDFFVVKIFDYNVNNKCVLNLDGIIFTDDMIEIAILSIISAASFKYPNMLRMYGATVCKSKIGMVVEKGEIDMFSFIMKNKKLDMQEISSYVFQIIFSILIMQEYGIKHNDISINNIVLFKNKIKNKYLHYTIDGINYYVPNYGYTAKIIDFGLAQKMTKPTLKSESIIDNTFYKYSIVDEWLPMYDILKFLIEIDIYVKPNISVDETGLLKDISKLLSKMNVYCQKKTKKKFLRDNGRPCIRASGLPVIEMSSFRIFQKYTKYRYDAFSMGAIQRQSQFSFEQNTQ